MRYRSIGKRGLDIVVGFSLAIVTLPVLAILSVGSLIAFRAQPFFVQTRIGKSERAFRFPKVRSLPSSAPRAVDKYALEDVKTNGYGRFLRRSHLDELPQLWLVVFGRMSLVGPRPEMPELLDRYPSEFREQRASVKPGCTGLWQVSEAAGGLIYEAPQYDAYYVEHISFRLDTEILLRTLRALVGRNSSGVIVRVPPATAAPSTPDHSMLAMAELAEGD